MNFSVFESPPFWSTQALITSELRSLSAGTPIVLPLRSAPVLIVESDAISNSLNGIFGFQIAPLAVTHQRQDLEVRDNEATALPLPIS